VKEAEMHSISVWWSAAGRVGLVFLLVFGANGCKEQPMVGKKKIRPVNCDQTIAVDPNKGAYPLAVFLCEDDTVTWDGKGHKFQVEFKAGSPFVHGQTAFDDQHSTGTVKNHYDQLEVYKYTITVDNTNVFDPQVVGGGNP
jgi:hypothetical protein